MKRLFEGFRAWVKEDELTEAANLNFKNYFMIMPQPDSWAESETIGIILCEISSFKKSFAQKMKDPELAGFSLEMKKEEAFEEAFIKSIRGTISAKPSDVLEDQDTPCWSEELGEIYEIHNSAAINKLGPMLYDFMLQAIVHHAGKGGLISDREKVSKHAQNVYANWLQRGSGATGIKVHVKPMDYSPPKNKTEPTNDDCEIYGDIKNPLNNVFYTENVTKEYGSLFERGKSIFNALTEKHKLERVFLMRVIHEYAHSFFQGEYDKVLSKDKH